MGTALVYHEDMAAARLLWDDPDCEIERPARLTTTLQRLQRRGLAQRCRRLVPREASEAELGLVHSPEYVALLRGTQALDTEALRALSARFDAVYLHPSTFRCARLAVGAALQLVDAVLTGAVDNGLALVRPPGHHSQRAAANGFCVFNNVAVAAQHAKRKHGLRRILIVDWDIHHGQGTQYAFEDDPSVLYFSWHRYEHGRFWPCLREGDADAVGRGPGRGFTVNLPWNQVGMGNADYLAAFLHVLLPLAFEFAPELVLVSAGFDAAIGDPEGQMLATPECFAHLTRLLQALAGGRVCAVLEGGYHLESLSLSVCMTVQTLLGDPTPPLPGPLVPQRSALESIQSVRAAQAPHWASIRQQGQRASGPAGGPTSAPPVAGTQNHLRGAAPAPSPGPPSPEGPGPSPPPPGGPACQAAAAQGAAALSSLLGQLRPRPAPSVRVAAALPTWAAALALPPDVLRQEGPAALEELQAWAGLHDALAQAQALAALGRVLRLLDGILDGQVTTPRHPEAKGVMGGVASRRRASETQRPALCVGSGIAAVPAPAAAATLDVAVRTRPSLGARRLFCVAVGQLERPAGLAGDGRSLWLNIGAREAAAASTFCVSAPLPASAAGVLSCLLGLVLPLAYGFLPDLVLLVLGPAHGLRAAHAALLAALLRGPAGGRILVLLDEESTPQLAGLLARVLRGEAPPGPGPLSAASPQETQALLDLRGQLGPHWKMLQVAAEP